MCGGLEESGEGRDEGRPENDVILLVRDRESHNQIVFGDGETVAVGDPGERDEVEEGGNGESHVARLEDDGLPAVRRRCGDDA